MPRLAWTRVCSGELIEGDVYIRDAPSENGRVSDVED